ncbi:peptidoglycan endopeptidase [Sphingomonas sp. JC676]|nr:peptidoglycan endopeptidase [Sphingomonas sp. JC676]
MRPGERGLAAARAALGVRFRLHGRDASGLDCVGLAALSMRAEGFEGRVPLGYALRTGDPEAARRAIEISGLILANGERPGDLLLVKTGPGQLHLAIAAEDGVIHADAQLRRVVERPGPMPWPVIGRWRVTKGD